MPSSRRAFLVSFGALTALGCRPGTARLVVRPDRSTTPGPETDLQTGDTGSASVDTGSGAVDTGTPPTDPWTGEPGPEPDPWQPPGTLDRQTFRWGVQTGDANATGAIVSVRTMAPSVRMVLVRGTEQGWAPELDVSGVPVHERVAQLELADLIPDTTYSLVFYDEGALGRSRVARFRTALYPGATRVVRFGATCCLGGNRPWRTLQVAADRKLDFFVLLGDTIYADDGWGGPDANYFADWGEALRTAGLSDVTASTSVVAVWDDHEVDNNWSYDDAGMPGRALNAKNAFRRALPQREGTVGSGLWRKLVWGDCLEVFALDCRGERMGGDYISPEQMDWLEQGLANSTARFKVILNSVPITDMDPVYLGAGAEDRWDGYPHQRRRILRFIEDNAIEGIVWLGGDFHWGALSRVGKNANALGYGQREVFVGPGGSPINPLGFFADTGGPQYELAITRHNYVQFELDPAAGTFQLAFIDDDGSVVAQRTLRP